MAVTKDQLLTKRAKTREVEIPDVGTVVVRSLTRAEAMEIGQGGEAAELERKMLAMALVDPEMTEDEVAEWQAAGSVGDIGEVVEAIIELSGMEVVRPKELMRQFRD